MTGPDQALFVDDSSALSFCDDRGRVVAVPDDERQPAHGEGPKHCTRWRRRSIPADRKGLPGF